MAHYVKVEPSFTLTEKNRFGGFLINSLRHKRHLKLQDHIAMLPGVYLYVAIPEHYESNYGIFISKKHQYRFNNFLLDEFNDRMLDYVIPNLSGHKGDLRKSLLNFRNQYDICEDELPYKTLEKQWERAYYYLTYWESSRKNNSQSGR